MSDRDPIAPDDDAEALAAEFVLGVLPLNERVLAAARVQADAGFAARVQAWENRLAALNDGFAATPAPDVLAAVEARLFPKAPKVRRGLTWGFLGGAVTAAILAAVLLLSEGTPPQGPALTATLTDPGQALSFAARFDAGRNELTLLRTAGTPPGPGQDLQLWAIGTDGTPRPLGLVREAETVIAGPGLSAGLVLAVSLEPQGGSPTGLPTGPVLVTGTLTDG